MRTMLCLSQAWGKQSMELLYCVKQSEIGRMSWKMSWSLLSEVFEKKHKWDIKYKLMLNSSLKASFRWKPPFMNRCKLSGTHQWTHEHENLQTLSRWVPASNAASIAELIKNTRLQVLGNAMSDPFMFTSGKKQHQDSVLRIPAPDEEQITILKKYTAFVIKHE